MGAGAGIVCAFAAAHAILSVTANANEKTPRLLLTFIALA
jgi:hypothetical protein